MVTPVRREQIAFSSTRPDMPEGVRLMRALADEHRLRTVLALQEGELCVCQIVALLKLAPSTVSRHLQLLRDAGLITSFKRGRWVYYRIAESNPNFGLAAALKPLLAAISETPQARLDHQRMREILAVNPETLCETHYGT